MDYKHLIQYEVGMVPKDTAFEISINRAQNWYNLLAEQRMRLMYFFVLILAGNMALVGSTYEKAPPFLLILVGIELSLVSVIFKLLDRRTAEMVKLAERALVKLEENLVSITGVGEMALIGNHEKRKAPSYRQLFNVLFLFGVIVGFGLIIFGGRLLLPALWEQMMAPGS